MSEQELKPCPFCGKAPKVMPSNPKLDGNAWGAVQCVNRRCPAQPRVEDGCTVADERGSDAYKALAIKKWNRRAAPPLLTDEQMPPLPEPWQLPFNTTLMQQPARQSMRTSSQLYAYTADQLHAYARAVESAVRKQILGEG